jgi:seryl-tRNA synthetase
MVHSTRTNGMREVRSLLDVRMIRQDPEGARRALGRRDPMLANRVDEVVELDKRHRQALARVESLRAERRQISERISQLHRQGRREEAEEAMARARALGQTLEAAEAEEAELRERVEEALRNLPNFPHPSVPDGGEGDEVEVRRWDAPPVAHGASHPLPHWEVGARLGILDFERAGKVSGSRFVYYTGVGARLERALINFMLDHHAARGYKEMWPPDLVTADTLYGTGHLPKFRADMFETTDGRFLISTAEIPLTAYHRDEILDASQLPIRYVAYTACFRSEAGAAGRDTRGLIRQHQFDKVELVTLCRPEQSYEVLEEMVRDAGSVLEALGLSYRVVSLAAGDLGFSSAKTYDLEVYLPGSGPGYREISSVSNVEAFQARRLGIRYREGKEKPAHVHTLNGSGVAVGRTVAAILEQWQREDGSVQVPPVLVPYMGGVEVLAAGETAPVA